VDVGDTTEDTLLALPNPPAAVTALLAYRQVAKRVSTYGLDFLGHVSPRTGRIHAGYKQLGADSGRMACSSPNLQNIPGERAYRECFVAPPGRVLIKVDLSQIELNAAAVISGDAKLLAALEREEDLHTKTAAGLFAVAEGDVTPQQRAVGKMINFGSLYGLGKPGLIKQAAAKGIRLTPGQAGTILADFKRTWPGFARWTQAQREDDDPVVVTVAGRWRTLPPTARDTQRVNTPVQGASADCLKAALALLWQTRHEAPSAVLVGAIHDELVAEADAGEEAVRETTRWLEGGLIRGTKRYLPDAPIRVKTTVGRTWGGTE
jgi:DNA polymerase-1